MMVVELELELCLELQLELGFDIFTKALRLNAP